MTLLEKYRKSKNKKWFMRFKTSCPEGSNYDGVVTHIQKNFIVLREGRDFTFQGVTVLPKKVIKGYRDGKFERCYNQILRHNGHIKNAKSPQWLDKCTTLKQILETLQKKDIWPAVEIRFELDGKIEMDFYVGQIMRIEQDAFVIQDYSAEGKWQDEWEIGYDEIFRIEFDDNYTRHFNAFMRTRMPKKAKA